MQRIRRIFWTTCLRTALLWGFISTLATTTWAKGEAGDKASETGASVWVLPYIFLILCVALGMLVVCKSSGRRDRAKPEAYHEGKGQQTEEAPKETK
jgi:hypothetical protein